MSTNNAGVVPAELRARYNELRAEKAALHASKPIDWAAVADVEDKLCDLMGGLSNAVWSHDPLFGCVAIDAMAGFRAAAYVSRGLAKQSDGEH